ncbi:hypothetical protein CEXT_60151 [Caerostris extrusa]|uniref:Uncharacterized protein n=1 Tax=Caerostris extrusa TaxID=172846 RepID=A0AAV4P2X5_CAEEX|nr:hypothetical protein CEXT_60151 [Caerostris extrusa]
MDISVSKRMSSMGIISDILVSETCRWRCNVNDIEIDFVLTWAADGSAPSRGPWAPEKPDDTLTAAAECGGSDDKTTVKTDSLDARNLPRCGIETPCGTLMISAV